MISHLIALFVGACVIGHGLVLLLSSPNWCNFLKSQLLVYDGDRQQAPQDLLNLLPQEQISIKADGRHTMCQILAFLCKKASA